MELFYTHGITATSKANYDHLWNQHSFAFTNDAFVDVQQKDLSDRVVEESSCKQEEVTSEFPEKYHHKYQRRLKNVISVSNLSCLLS